MNDKPAEAVETKPPTARTRAPRKRQAAPEAAQGQTSGETAAPEDQIKAVDEPVAPKRTRASRSRKAASAGEAAASANISESPAPSDAAAPSGEAEAPPRTSRQRKPRAPRAATKAESVPADSGSESDQSSSAPAQTESAAQASTESSVEDSASGDRPRAQGRPRRRRSRSSGGDRSDFDSTEASPDQQAPEASGPAQGEGGDDQSSDRSGGQVDGADAGPAATTARTRNRRRRSRRGGGGSGGGSGGGGSDQRSNGAGPAESPPSAGADDTEVKTPAALDSQADSRQTEPRQSDGTRSSSSGRGKKRRSSRRSRPEQLAPLGPRKMLVSAEKHSSQIAVLEGRDLIEHYVAKDEDESIVGNIYIGRVENVLPGMEAAFLDIGEARNAVLYVGEVSYEEDDLEGPAPRIETLLKSGQAVVAQVTKDPMGHKGARLTTEVSLAGRYLVLVPNADSLGISRRLSDTERRRLRDIANRIRPEGHGMIVRTAAIGASEEDLQRDVARLTRIWNEVAERIDGSKPPKLIYSEPPLAIRVVRDLFTADVEQVIVDQQATYDQVRDYLEEVAPEFAERVELYIDPLPLFERYHVMEQVRKAVDRRVWLTSGGHIVIDRTEAMTVIDVNTGRFVGRSTLEETVLHANLEAAEEIARQLRLRDIGGIIVIDFIDMGYERNRDELLRTFERALMRDKTRTQVYGVSELGLIQMTRKRVSEGLLEAFSTNCEACEGRGVVLNDF